MTFDYDPQKSRSNKSKHGIDFVQAQVLWNQRVLEVQAKPGNGEIRYANVGKIGEDYWPAIITYRGATRRIISVYRSNDRQIAYYERSRKPEG